MPAARLVRMLWIAMFAALGVTAARPDVTGADDGIATADSRLVRESGTVPYRPPFGEQAVRMEAMKPLFFASDDRSVFSHDATNATIPVYAPFDEPRTPAAPSGMFAAYPSDTPPRPSSQYAAPATNPAHASVPDVSPLQYMPKAPETPSLEETPSVPEPSIPQPAVYVVTAYYLNVRAEPDKTSPIRGLLERGDLVTVVGKTENGWLELDSGLFIHGAYAEPAEPEAVAARKAGREVTVASASSTVRAEPAIRKTSPAEIGGGPSPLSKKVKSASGLTEEDIAKLLEGTELEGHGLEDAILGIEEEYGINALFTIAVMKLESGNGKSKLAREKNNLFGLNATGGGNSKAYRFETKSDSVYKFGKIIAKSYLDKGYSTIEKVGKKYCPSNPKWASLVENIMKRDHRKLVKAAV